MIAPLPRHLLRPDTPKQASFTVSDRPCRAKLDQNEMPCPLPDAVKETILAALAEVDWHRYPQPARYVAIKARFSSALGLPPERVVITAGCDQVILLAYWLAGGHGRKARLCEPTYPMYGHYARITQTALQSVVLGPAGDPAAGTSAGDEDFAIPDWVLFDPVDLLLLVNPQNPTGAGLSADRVAAALPAQGLTLVDEAYGDFSGETVLPLLEDHPNLLVGRSLSKVLLAGVRLGYAVGHPEVIAACERLLFAPYHLSALQLAVADHLELVRPLLAERVAAVMAERQRVRGALTHLGLRVWPSQGNFLLFEVPDAPGVTARLLDAGVRLRDVSSMPGLGQHLRVTIGQPEENDLFLEALARVLEG